VVVLDKVGDHTSPALRAGVGRGDATRVEPVLLPAYAPHRHLIERLRR